MVNDTDRLFDAIRKWLESREGITTLNQVARSVISEARSRHLSPEYLKMAGMPDTGDEDIIGEIRQELALFILEKEGLQKRLITEGKNLSKYLRTAFIFHWIEKTRRSGLDPWRSLYKHTAALLNESADFHSYARGSQGTAFSMSRECSPIPPLAEEDLSVIPFPDHIPDSHNLDNIKKKATLLALATYFHQKVCSIFPDTSVLIDLRDFINWIGLHVSLAPAKTTSELSDDQIHGEQEQVAHPGTDKEIFNPGMIRQWAEKFANILNEKEKAVTLLAYGEGLTLREMAQKLGYKGPSSPKYQRDQVQEKLKFFLRDLPWLSPEDLNEEAFSLFLNTLFFILKKS